MVGKEKCMRTVGFKNVLLKDRRCWSPTEACDGI